MVKRIDQTGFSLIEVLIALTIFATLSVSMVWTVSVNLNRSINTRADVELHTLAEFKMNEVLIGNREFTNATDNSEDAGNFEIEGFEDYKYKVQIRRMELPNLADIMGQRPEDQNGVESQELAIRRRVFGIMKQNLEEIIWQVKVEVQGPVDENVYTVTSWIEKSNAQINKNFGF